VIAGEIAEQGPFDRSGLQNLVQDKATISLATSAIATTIVVYEVEQGADRPRNAFGRKARTLASPGEPVQTTTTINGERTMGAYEPLLDYDQKVIGAIYVGRPLAFIDSINRARRRSKRTRRADQHYIIASAAISLLIAILDRHILLQAGHGTIDQLRKRRRSDREGPVGLPAAHPVRRRD